MKRSALTFGLAAGLMALAASQAALPGAHAQGSAGTVKIDDFESGVSDWQAIKFQEGVGGALDESAKVAAATEAQQPKVGKGALVYTYEVQPKIVPALGLTRAVDLTGMKSLRFWVRTSHPTTLNVMLKEKGGASYQDSFYCDAEGWVEQAVNLAELDLDYKTKDENGKLDLDQIGSLAVMDLSGMLVNLVPSLKGSRTLSLDDITCSSQAVPRSQGEVKAPAGQASYLLDSFENRTIRWLPLGLDIREGLKITAFETPLRIDTDVPNGGGKASLQASYTRLAGRGIALLRNLENTPYGAPVALVLNIKTARDGAFLFALEEKDGSRYEQIVQLQAGDLWKDLRLPLNTFNHAENSLDENQGLDALEIKQITIADLSGVAGVDVGGTNTLYLDQVSFAQ